MLAPQDLDRTRRRLADNSVMTVHLILAAAALKPDTETIIAGLLQAAFKIATYTKIPGIAIRCAHTMRQFASMIEAIEAAKERPLH
jgi:hypothetical protein